MVLQTSGTLVECTEKEVSEDQINAQAVLMELYITGKTTATHLMKSAFAEFLALFYVQTKGSAEAWGQRCPNYSSSLRKPRSLVPLIISQTAAFSSETTIIKDVEVTRLVRTNSLCAFSLPLPQLPITNHVRSVQESLLHPADVEQVCSSVPLLWLWSHWHRSAGHKAVSTFCTPGNRVTVLQEQGNDVHVLFWQEATRQSIEKI